MAEIHLVRNLNQALSLATSLGVEGIIFDVEGVLHPYIGNDTDSLTPLRQITEHENVAAQFLLEHGSICAGIATNNTNEPIPGANYGFVDQVRRNLSAQTDTGSYTYVALAHKGMKLNDGSILGKKPDGSQTTYCTKELGLDPKDVVLIDDQGVKNAGEAVVAGLKAIIVPDPIGFLNEKGQVIEHKWVRRFRNTEPAIYESLRKKGTLARIAYQRLAGISIDSITNFQDLR